MDKAYVRQGKTKGKSNLILSVAKGLLISAVIACAAVFIGCAAAMKFDDPIKSAPIFGVGAMMLGSFFGGFFSAKFYGERGAATGVLFGAIYVLIVAVASLIFGARVTTAAFAIIAPTAVLVALLGGIAGTKGSGAKKKKRKSF